MYHSKGQLQPLLSQHTINYCIKPTKLIAYPVYFSYSLLKHTNTKFILSKLLITTRSH